MTSNRSSLLEALWDQSTFGIAQVSLAGRWLQANHKICDVTGYTQDELLAMHSQQLTHLDDRIDHNEVVRALTDHAEKSITREKRYMHKQGHAIWVSVTVSLVREDGEPSYLIAVIENIDARKRAELELLRLGTELERRVLQCTQDFHTLLDISHDAYVSMDERGRIVDWNACAEKLFGWSAHEVAGKSLSVTLIPPKFREAHRQGVEDFLRTGKTSTAIRRVPMSALRRDGSEIQVEISICPLPTLQDGCRFGAFVHPLQDIEQNA